MEQLILKAREERRLRQGHLWIFSNEVSRFPASANPGDLVEVVGSSGQSFGSALYHPHSLITGRLVGSDIRALDDGFFTERISKALQLREQLFPDAGCYRLVYGESDFVPGLVIDRYSAYLVVQIFSAGVELQMDALIRSLERMFQPAAILERNDVDLRSMEGLQRRKGVLSGSYSGPVEISECGVRYRLDLMEGQKTGFFLDQRENRLAASRYCRGQRVFDGFCNQGGFALQAALRGAQQVIAVDSSGQAVDAARINARLSGLQIEVEQADVFDYLSGLVSRAPEFDVVILDPPSFAPRKKDVVRARKAYQKLNELGMRVLRPGGILVTASCSYHLREDVFYQVIRQAGYRAGRRLQLLERRGPSPDHPIHPAMPETHYLKLGILRVL